MALKRMRRRWRTNAVAKLKTLDRWDEEKHNWDERSVVSRSSAGKGSSAVVPEPPQEEASADERRQAPPQEEASAD